MLCAQPPLREPRVGRSTPRRALLLLVGALLLASCATTVEEQSWISVQTAHFELVSSASPERTLAMARELERFRAVVMRTTSVQEFDPRVPTRMYVFRSAASFAPFKWTSGLGGYLLPTLRVNYMVVDASATQQQPMSTIFHEYVHFVMRNQGSFHYPLWYGEGLAEYLSTVEFEDDAVHIGRPPELRWQWLANRRMLPLRDVLDAVSLDDRGRDWTAMFYAQAWVLTHYLVLGSERAGEPRAGQDGRYVTLLNQGVAQDAAIEQTFGDLDALQDELREYVARGKIPYLSARASAFPADVSVRSSPVPLSTVQLQLAELQMLLARNGPRHVRHARQLVDRVLAVEPHNIRARILNASILAREGRLTPSELESVLSDVPEDAFLAVQAGDLITGILRGSKMPPAQRLELTDTARRLYGTALALDPESPAALAGLGATYLYDPDPIDGIRALEQARTRVRWSTDVSLLLARLYMRTNETGHRRARALLEEVIVWTHDPRQAQEARAHLGRLTAQQ